MTLKNAFIAANRFGLGARSGDLARIKGDPRGWVENQIGPARAVPALAHLPSSREIANDFFKGRKDRKDEAKRKIFRKWLQRQFIAEAAARTQAQIDSEDPIRERLTVFWSNHFTVSARKPVLKALAGPFEREAIRPHVTGSFADMLLASTRHPAMLAYLDNLQSIGPNSPAGRRRNKGLNENLAREILELHTLGVNGGYGQPDVIALAKMLTGWSVGRGRRVTAGAFAFRAAAHEPGAKTFLGRRYGEAGEEEAETALRAIARHPSTARHVAFKLARHFIADSPPERVVARLARVFLETEGDLAAMTRAVADADEAWADPLAKVKTPNDFVVSVMRAIGMRMTRKDGDVRKLIAPLRLMGQMPFRAPSPAGWPDEAAHWISPESVLKRAELSMMVARKIARVGNPEALLAETVGPVAGKALRRAVRAAPGRVDAIATILASSEFQRR
ncbi:MAG: DUF1800 domain-containing protein [Alphaproteobacteria bacterium]|nr:DUF1800 domain-containing protein [Alphaproteobacteria bacterium]